VQLNHRENSEKCKALTLLAGVRRSRMEPVVLGVRKCCPAEGGKETGVRGCDRSTLEGHGEGMKRCASGSLMSVLSASNETKALVADVSCSPVG
jgi:hypothetical protein